MSILADSRLSVSAGGLAALVVALGEAVVAEHRHQRSCPARASGEFCQSCLDYEAAWLRADNAVGSLGQIQSWLNDGEDA